MKKVLLILTVALLFAGCVDACKPNGDPIPPPVEDTTDVPQDTLDQDTLKPND